MDRSQTPVIVISNLTWPNGLAVDHENERRAYKNTALDRSTIRMDNLIDIKAWKVTKHLVRRH